MGNYWKMDLCESLDIGNWEDSSAIKAFAALVGDLDLLPRSLTGSSQCCITLVPEVLMLSSSHNVNVRHVVHIHTFI